MNPAAAGGGGARPKIVLMNDADLASATDDVREPGD